MSYYLDEFVRFSRSPELLSLKLFPNAKEITESFGAYAAVREHLQLDFGAGATPAHVARDAFLSEFGNIPDAMEVGGAKLEAWGRVALAILNSFGGTSEAMQTAQNEIARLKIHGRFTRHLAAEALGRVQKRLMPTARNEHYNINTRTIQEAFDNELAALESVKPAQQ